MKKIITVILVLLGILIYTRISTKDVFIPKEAIRFRVIANSNTKEDQNIKILVRNDLEKVISNDLANSKNINDSRKILSTNIDRYENIISNTLESNNIRETFTINYGLNFFPEKKYKGVTYEKGNYESLVVTLGNGKGNNWWCVLFPPLCLLEAEEDYNTEEVEYKSYIKEIIDKYIK